MNNWIIVGIIAGLLIVGGIALVSAFSVDNTNQPASTSTCTSCGGKCTVEKNCGLAACGATQGKACNCGK